MSDRELVMLGTASQAPTRQRNHNGYLLRWDGHSILFDPGEGTQRQFTFAGVSAASVTRICVSHFHGDHCLGLPGMIMRLAIDAGHLPVPIHYPASGQEYFERLRFATAGQQEVPVDAHPIDRPGVIHHDDDFTLSCAPLVHPVDVYGFRLVEPDRRRFVPEMLEAAGVRGRAIGQLRTEGSIEVDGRTVRVEEVSEHRRGQVFAFVMDTAICDAAFELAAGADLLLCESTFMSSEERLASQYGHMTARQAGRLAREAGVRRLVLSHFSRRYPDVEVYGEEAREEHGDVVVPSDFERVAVPDRD